MIGLQFDDDTATSRGLTAANWGNRIIRTATRRRHADSRLLVLPNPHHCRHGGRRRDRRAWRRRQGQAAVLVGGSRAWLRCPWAAAGPGRASRRRAERSSRRGRLAGGPPPTGTTSSPARQHTNAARNTSSATSNKSRKPPTSTHSGQAQTCVKPRPADAGRGFRYPVGYEV